ncbi:MAG: type II toxin-antitoxin system HicA family toxin [Bacteroidetes bacterium]|nr:type II toxin-antitoxin system HicA family toxin [Bacteroidota bacterium]
MKNRTRSCEKYERGYTTPYKSLSRRWPTIIPRQPEKRIPYLRHLVRPPLTIPNHKEIARGTLRQIINDAGFTIKQF